MQLSRSLPPQFLLPAWGTRQLLGALQRAHQSTNAQPKQPNPPNLQVEDERSHEATPPVRRLLSLKEFSKSSTRRQWTGAPRAHRIQLRRSNSQFKHEGDRKSTRSTHHSVSEGRDRSLGPTASSNPPLVAQHRADEEHESLKTSLLEDDSSYEGRTSKAVSIRHVPDRYEYEGDINRLGYMRLGEVGSTSSVVEKSQHGTAEPLKKTRRLPIAATAPLRDERNPNSMPIKQPRMQTSSLAEQTSRWPHDIPLGRIGSTNSVSGFSGERDYRSKSSIQPEQAEPASPIGKKAHNGTSKLPLEETQLASSPPDDIPPNKATASVPSTRTKPTGSLFNELFPEETKFTKEMEKKPVEKLPVFEWYDGRGPKIDWQETVAKAAEGRKNWFHTVPESTTYKLKVEAEERSRKRELSLSVLVLSSASKTLEESDFFRLGNKGEHIEGWTSGIVKVIKGRDNQTLDPLCHYFLIFSNQAAASAYLDQTTQLHKLARIHGIGDLSVPFPASFARPGEAVKDVLRGFSLVPGQTKLSLRLINRPYSPAVSQILSNGGPAAIARQKTKSEDMVLFSVGLGDITYWDVRNLISDDGKKRNLHWRLTEGEGAIVQIKSGQLSEEDDSSDESRDFRPDRRRFWGHAKYILSFQDSHEARRFVREWHRRPFPIRKEHKLGDEPPPIINAEMFW